MFEQYKIGIHIALTDNATGPIAFLTKHLMLSEAAAAKLQTRLVAIKGFFVGGGLLLGAGAAIGAPLLYAIDKAAQLQKQLIAVQIATRSTTADMNAMRGAIEGIASQTVFSNIDVAKQAKLIATGTGLNAAQVQGVLPAYAKYADVQLLMKGSSYEQSISDAIKAAHGAGHYDAASLTSYLDKLNKASLVIPGSTSEIVKGLAYFQQVSKNVLGMDDDNSILGIALMNRLGSAGTRGGTQLSAALTRSIPGIFGSGLLKGKSQEALGAMGMVDPQGHAKVFTNGKFDMFKWMGLTADYVSREMATHPEAIARQDIMKNFQHAYGTIGSRPTAMLGTQQAIAAWTDLSSQFSQYGGFEAMQKQFADDSVAQKWMNAQTNFTSAMTELGFTLLPTATTALKQLNTYMGTLITWMTKNPGKVGEYATNIGKLAIALGGLGVVSVVTSGVTGLVTALGLLRIALGATAAAAAGNTAVNAFNPMGSLGGAPKMSKWSKVGGALKMLAVLGTSYELTDFIANDLLGLDSALGQAFSKSYDPNAKPKGTTTVHTTINMDGKKVAQVVTKHQAKEFQRPETGTSGFDPIQSLTPPGL